MPGSAIDSDRKFAKKVCEELRRGRRKAFKDLIHRYYGKFIVFAKRRLYAGLDPEDVVQSFCLLLLDDYERTLCRYEGQNKSSLFTFLVTILYRHIQDANRSIQRERTREPSVSPEIIEQMASLSGGSDRKGPRTTGHNPEESGDRRIPAQAAGPSAGGRRESEPPIAPGRTEPALGNKVKLAPEPLTPLDPEAICLRGEAEQLRNRLLCQAMMLLMEERPDDAALIRLRLRELSYKEIIAWQLVPAVESEDVLKTRYKRARERLEKILKQLARDRCIGIHELFCR